MSDAGNFMLNEKSEVRSPLLDKDRDDENGFQVIDKDQIEGVSYFFLKEKVEVHEVAPKIF